MITFEVINATFSLQCKFAIKNWIKEILLLKNLKPGSINFIFADDEYVLATNRDFLGHDYYTDIITFDTSEYDPMHISKGKISADIIISLDTVLANSHEYGSTFTEELYRVMSHGLFHLMGYDDHNEEDIKEMRAAENLALRMSAESNLPSQKYTNSNVRKI